MNRHVRHRLGCSPRAAILTHNPLPQADFELPHIPHMTTITSAIKPTPTLVQWREKYSSRYTTRLSDHSPTRRISTEPTGIRSRKTWIIEHTMYVSTREGGTQPFRSPNPKQFHEMQWNIGYKCGGKLVEERQVSVSSLSLGSEDRQVVPAERPSRLSLATLARRVVRKKAAHDDARRKSWFSNVFAFDTVLSFREFLDSRPIPLPEGCPVPNAIFARKFGLVANGQPLPPSLPVKAMPTAESKATETVVKAAACSATYSTWEFRGPFTPQLGFDGGLDFRWVVSDQSTTRATGTCLASGGSPSPLQTLSSVTYCPPGSERPPSLPVPLPFSLPSRGTTRTRRTQNPSRLPHPLIPNST